MNAFSKLTFVFTFALILVGCSDNTPNAPEDSSENIEREISQEIEPVTKEKESSVVALNRTLTPVDSISHAHGISVDVADSDLIYIATHHGLLLLENEKTLSLIGDADDDFMGFTAHPNDPNVLFMSGHPKEGGNLGIRRSNDGGMNWDKISDGVGGPVDFHSMAISSANPDILYGWYGGLQRSVDGGESWEKIDPPLPQVISLSTNPHDENVVYAATVNGVQRSTDMGASWSAFAEDTLTGAVTTIAVDPVSASSNNLLSYSQSLGLAKSMDGGINWSSISTDIGMVSYFAFDSNKPGTVYAFNRENALYKSVDLGDTWTFVQ